VISSNPQLKNLAPSSILYTQLTRGDERLTLRRAIFRPIRALAFVFAIAAIGAERRTLVRWTPLTPLTAIGSH
jgi:hypothetical protein